jgi:hypothetical protein
MKSHSLLFLFVVVGGTLCRPSLGEDYPLHPVPSNLALPTNAIVKQYVAPPAPFTESSVDASPAPLASFLAQTNNADIRPPDTMGAVGPNHVVSMLNSGVRIQNRSGTTNISTVSLDAWWTNATFNVFDPRIVYDSLSSRWIASASTEPTNAVLLAVSQTSDPTGAWYFQRIDTDPANDLIADFPQLGFNKNWIVVTANLYHNDESGFDHARVYMFDKTNVFAGGTNVTITNLTASLGPTIVPMTTTDASVATLTVCKHGIRPR